MIQITADSINNALASRKDFLTTPVTLESLSNGAHIGGGGNAPIEGLAALHHLSCVTRSPDSGEKVVSAVARNCIYQNGEWKWSDATLEVASAAVVSKAIAVIEAIAAQPVQVGMVIANVNGKALFRVDTISVPDMTPHARVRAVVDMANEGVISGDEAILAASYPEIVAAKLPITSPKDGAKPLAIGTSASGITSRALKLVSIDGARELAPEVLCDHCVVAQTTTPADLGVMKHAAGLVVIHGGYSSHAAFIARAYSIPCIIGVTSTDSASYLLAKFKGETVRIHGDSVYKADDIEEKASFAIEAAETLLQWASDDYAANKHLVALNADTPEEFKSLHSEANGLSFSIGLCRTEHMFFDKKDAEADDIGAVLCSIAMMQMVIESNPTGSIAKTAETLLLLAHSSLHDMQRDSFVKLLSECNKQYKNSDNTVTVRLLDPPVHEFAAQPVVTELLHECLKVAGFDADADDEEAVREFIGGMLHESTPMLGCRGARLGLTSPDIYNTQLDALAQAIAITEVPPHCVKVMIPMVSWNSEFSAIMRACPSVAALREVGVLFGMMLETPASVLALEDTIAEDSAFLPAFYSIGTNDLTQMTLGVSRDDAWWLQRYYQLGITADPFKHLDNQVCKLIAHVVITCSAAGVKMPTICGYHASDAYSIRKVLGLVGKRVVFSVSGERAWEQALYALSQFDCYQRIEKGE